MNQTSPYEKVVTEEAAKWFPDCEDLLIWAWDEAVPGPCHPLAVVAAWEDRLAVGRSLLREASLPAWDFA